MKALKIGVCGVGNVGGAVIENLTSSPQIVESNGGVKIEITQVGARKGNCLLYTSPSPRDVEESRMPSSA